jgi:hypothetical protein
MNGSEPMDDPISDNNVSTTNELSDNGYDTSPIMVQGHQQQCWDLKEEEEVVAELPEMIAALPMGVAVGGGGGGAGGRLDDGFGGGGYGGVGDNSGRRFRGRMGAKGIGAGPMMPSLSDTHGTVYFKKQIQIY